jgi:sugar diacid utilization regulator
MSELQKLVDSLAIRIDRSVAIDDQRFRLAVFSSHKQDIDDVRRASILSRESPAEAARWMIQHGVQEALDPVRIEGSPGLGMRSRVCIPIRFDGFLLGYMWLIEDSTRLTDQDLAECVEAATDAAPLMYRERMLEDDTRGRERRCVVDLLDPSAKTRSAAAHAALEDGLLLASGAYGVIAVESRRPLDGRVEEHTVTVLAALEHARRTVRPHGCVAGNLGSRGVLIAALRGGDDRSAELARIARRLLSDLHASGARRGEWRLGKGPPVSELASVIVSYRAALDAVRIAAALPELGDIAAWDELGAWKLLSLIADDDHMRSAIHPGLAKLAALRDGDALLETLETYLDSGGDAQCTAGKLFIHRTSLYARLHRIEREAGVALGSGEDRLALHISLRLTRLNRGEPVGGGTNGVPAPAN